MIFSPPRAGFANIVPANEAVGRMTQHRTAIHVNRTARGVASSHRWT
jgi:hypothetical protein